MIRRNESSTPRKSTKNSVTKRNLSASPGRRISPRKLLKLNDTDKSPFTTPTKSFVMESLDDVLHHYFSPKKKSPTRKNTKRQINFDTDEELSDEDNNENIKPSVQAQEDIKCNLEELSQCFTSIDSYLPDSFLKLEEVYEETFLYWKNMLITGRFNILLHGFGAKQFLLNKFVDQILFEYNCITFKCFIPGINCRKMFDAISDEFDVKIPHRMHSLNEWADELRTNIENKYNNFFIALHNIDANDLRDSFQQEALSILAESKKIHIIASVDHNNATLLWNQKVRDRFNWLFVPVPTYRTHGNKLLNFELKSLGLNSKQGSRAHTFASLSVVWQASTEKSRKILQQLAVLAGSYGAKDDVEPLTLPAFCKVLKQEFATTSEATLRQQLTEFIDSSIIRMDKEGTIQLLVDRSLLISFLETKDM